MKGCNRTKKRQQRGGTCGLCQTGGAFYKQGYPVPAPLVGNPWGPLVRQWPGVDGIPGDRNYFVNNLYNHGDPQTAMKLQSGGGKRKRKTRSTKRRRPKGGRKSKGKRGGGLIPQDLVNVGRSISHSVGSAFNGMIGVQAPRSPMPFADQFRSLM